MARSPNAAHIDAEQLASLSHEFRTPLNGVLGMTRLLEGTGLSAEQKTYVAALRESGEHLLGLVNDVLDFAKLGAGQTDLNPVTFDLEGLLRAVCELLAPRAQEKGLEIAWSVPAGMGQVLADEGRLRQILLNFAGNAIKFTGSGGVLLSLTETAPDRLKFTVSDTGPGVSDAARDRIFEAFAQADPAYDGAQLGGAGLGLAIARKLAASMGGEVGLEPAWGDGASFWFEATLPHRPRQTDPVLVGLNLGLATQNPILRAAAKGQIEASGGAVCDHSQPDLWLVDYVGEPLTPIVGAPCIVLLEPRHRSQIEAFRKDGFAGYLIKPLRRSSLSERVLAALAAGADRMSSVDDERVAPALAAGTRVLLVEDNAINALLARTLLTREGCLVDQASGGEEALAALQVGTYDLVLMDMRMPGLSGPEATRTLRQRRVTTPVVALTANAFDDDRAACLAAGMQDFLVKPLSPEALRRVLSRLAQGGWTESQLGTKVA